jgi:hypothetical protein
MHYWKFRLCRARGTLGKGLYTLGKAFAERCSRQRAPGIFFSRPRVFAEHPNSRLSAKALPRANCGPPAKKVAINGDCRLTAFETPFADGLMAGPSANKCFYFFLKKYVPRTRARTIGKDVFHFLKNPLPSGGAGDRRQRCFLFFKTNASLPMAPLGKAGNFTVLSFFFPH